MQLTRSFKDTIRERVAQDPGFRECLLKESIECMLSGDIETGKIILREYFNITVGPEELGALADKSPENLIRMFGLKGNPAAKNLFRVIQKLQEKEGLVLKVHTTH